MEYRQLYDNAVIIAPREEWDFFFAYRKEFPNASFSLFSEEDLEELFSYRHDDRAIVRLVRDGYSYEKAVDVLSAIKNLYLADDSDPKLHELRLVRDSLLKDGLLFSAEYPERTFKDRSIVVHGYHDGTRISLVLRDLPNITISYDDGFFDLAAKLPVLYRCPDVYSELHFVFNRIAALIDEGTPIDSIFIAGAHEAYDYLLPLFARAYGFAIEERSRKSLADLPLGHFFIEKTKSFGPKIAYEKTEKAFPDDLNLADLALIASHFLIEGYSNERQAELYHDILKKTRESKPRLTNSIHLLDGYHVASGGHVFFLSFALGNAPRNHRDDDYLSDDEKRKLSLPTSLDLFREDKADLIALLKSGSIATLTFAEKSLGKEYFDSPILLDLPLESSSDLELTYEYSRPLAKLWCSSLLDSYVNYLKTDRRVDFLVDHLHPDYRTYDFHYRPFAAFPKDETRHYSYSSVNLFYECQFHYYCQYVLNLKEEGTIFMAKVGTLYHQVLERMYGSVFDFDKEWNTAFLDIESDPRNGPFTPKERVLLIRLKDELALTVLFIKAHESKMADPIFDEEYSFSYPLSDLSSLVGSIDKAVRTGSGGRYLSIIDYKTGSTDFDESLNEFGLSMQLPIYAYVALHDPHFEGAELIGLYIDHILAKKLIKGAGADFDKFHYDQLMLKGLYINEVDKLMTFEPDYHDSTFIRGLKYTEGKGFSLKNRAAKSSDDLRALSDLAETKVKAADGLVRSYDFAINPKRYGAKVNACQYCPFGDVCFVRDEARITLRKSKPEEKVAEGEEGNDE